MYWSAYQFYCGKMTYIKIKSDIMCIYAGIVNTLIFGLTTCHDSAFVGLVMLFVHLRKSDFKLVTLSSNGQSHV